MLLGKGVMQGKLIAVV